MKNQKIKKRISIVIPLLNEKENVRKLHSEIVAVLKAEKLENSEIIFVDDGSTDGTIEEMKNLYPLKIIVFRKNFGQTSALDAGIKAAKGEVIITMDGDLQNDPRDIPKLLKKIDEGFDVVSGWRKNRQDPFMKKFLSRGADWLRKFLIDDKINDSGCTLKAYRKECFRNVDLYGEMHRFIPAILKIKGYRIGEVEVNHRLRQFGKTKYNYKRLLKGFLDLISVWFWKKYSSRPLHLFGFIGTVMFFIGLILLFWMAYERLILGNSIGTRIWPIIGVFMIVIGIQFFISGLLADISLKNYYQSRKELPYTIKEIIENKK